MEKEQNEVQEEKPTYRGFSILITEELFADIICKALGLGVGSISHIQATTEHIFKGVKLSAMIEDERFPIVKEGHEMPLIYPILKRDEDGNIEFVDFKVVK